MNEFSGSSSIDNNNESIRNTQSENETLIKNKKNDANAMIANVITVEKPTLL